MCVFGVGVDGGGSGDERGERRRYRDVGIACFVDD